MHQILTIIPIFLRASILTLAFFSFTWLKERLMMRRGANLSLCFISKFKTYSLILLYDKFRFEVLFSS